MQKITFAAMSHDDPSVVTSVKSLVQNGFLKEIVQIVRQHQDAQSPTPEQIAQKIRAFGPNWIKQSFNTKDRRVTSTNITAIEWKPGSATANIFYTFDLTDYSGIINKFRTFKGWVQIDVQTWLAKDWKHSRI